MTGTSTTGASTTGASTTLRVGTRASALAVAQATGVAEALGGQLVPIESEGDRATGSLASLGGTGVFATALREALLRGEVDVVVHSCKDLPTAPADGLSIAALPSRVDPRDALCARGGATMADLPNGARVGTGSPRRRAQLAARRPDLVVTDIRGNIDTRLQRLHTDHPERALDAIVLAAAGLERLGRTEQITELMPLDVWPTAPAQGALAVETRAGQEHLAASLDHADTRYAVTAERRVLALLEAGCAAPLGAHAFVSDGMIFLSATVYAVDGMRQLTASHASVLGAGCASGLAAADEVAGQVSAELLARGAAELMNIQR